ncbi:hypothetical protein VspSTUT16_11810 [Vibrio sp. STUT-A16]|nr:hypothetical protein VspSTUT16_11810 [Vibrio sp. STUT-A16]CDT89470.1 hypothetical protein VDIAB_220035 [Vibrio diabolicus]
MKSAMPLNQALAQNMSTTSAHLLSDYIVVEMPIPYRAICQNLMTEYENHGSDKTLF